MQCATFRHRREGVQVRFEGWTGPLLAEIQPLSLFLKNADKPIPRYNGHFLASGAPWLESALQRKDRLGGDLSIV
jgi:hypothetical protein